MILVMAVVVFAFIVLTSILVTITWGVEKLADYLADSFDECRPRRWGPICVDCPPPQEAPIALSVAARATQTTPEAVRQPGIVLRPYSAPSGAELN